MHFFVIFFEKIPPACLDGNPPPFTREAESLRLALTRPTSLYKGGRIPPACLDEANLPLQGRQKADFKSHALSVNNNKIPEDKK